MFVGTVEREHLDSSGSGESKDRGVFRQVFEESKGGTTAETSIVCIPWRLQTETQSW